jgi:hypothetical protein
MVGANSTGIVGFLGSTGAGNVILALIAITPLLGWFYRIFLSNPNYNRIQRL